MSKSRVRTAAAAVVMTTAMAWNVPLFARAPASNRTPAAGAQPAAGIPAAVADAARSAAPAAQARSPFGPTKPPALRP